MTGCYYKVRQLLQSVTVITKWDVTNVQILKDIATQIFKEAGFVLHKWHSNFSELEENNPEQS